MRLNCYKITSYIVTIVIIVLIISAASAQLEMQKTTPFEKNLEPLIEKPYNNSSESSTDLQKQPVETIYVDKENNTKSYVYKPKEAFKLVVTKAEVPYIPVDKSIYGIITMRITPDYYASSQVIYAKRQYKFDRLSWAIRTGWNETIPILSRLSEFKKYLKPFNESVYAHFYIMGVQEYPEYPGQYYHWPREILEDYYLYILQKIDSVAYEN